MNILLHYFASGSYARHAVVSTHFFNNLTTDIAVAASSPVVGSSRNTILGDMINSIPMLVSFFSPPEIPLKSSVPIYIA